MRQDRGLHPAGRVRLRPGILRDGQRALAARHDGARFDYVFHGVLMVDGGVGRKAAYDPRTWSGKGQAAMAARVARACVQLGAAGRSL